MLLYHYSDKNIKDKIKTSYFGYNSYSNNSKKLSNIKRSYYYINSNDKEYYFNSAKYRYTVIINKNKLYNITLDKLRLVTKYNCNYTKVFNYLVKRGYIGIIGNNGYNIVNLFININYKIKEILC